MNYWHAVPVHYIPTLLATGRLLSAARLPSGVIPRPTSILRKRKLGLEDFVHLSFQSITPLLADKHAKGYPHALIRFPESIADLPGAAFLKWNTKKWAHRDEFVPVSDPDEKAAFLLDWQAGKFPSPELLIPQSLDLALADGFFIPEGAWQCLLPIFTLTPELFPPLAPCPHESELLDYLTLAMQGIVLPLLLLPFD
jgi:hypothetical protein